MIGDRRTAALVAADGTIDWHCLPDYDGEPVFGCLLDPDNGGFWRLAPLSAGLGNQHYLESTAVLLTEWETPAGRFELCDAMLWADDVRQRDSARSIVRRLRCLSGGSRAVFSLHPRAGFAQDPVAVDGAKGFLSLKSPSGNFGLWTSFALQAEHGSLSATVEMAEGDVLWALFGLDQETLQNGAEQVPALLEETVRYWKEWSRGLNVADSERKQIERSAITVHLLTYAPAGSAVAAVTTSLPERMGGDRNWDYRFAWVRDASLSLALLSLLGKAGEVDKYLDWLSHRERSADAPLQVLYRVDGRAAVDAVDHWEQPGYCGSRPVRFGNRAFDQRQHGSVGYLADCALIYLDNGGTWKEHHWDLIRRVADTTARVWREPDNGIWELPDPVHWVTSKVMSWVVLDRAITIARKTGRGDSRRWEPVRDEIRLDVLERGWSEGAGSFRQHYDSDEVDASLLLIPIMEFLPAEDSRVAATVARIERELTIGGLVHRFRPQASPGLHTTLPVGVYEGAFFPATFWLATTYAKAGKSDQAEAILDRCQKLAGGNGLFSEEVDARTGRFLGNTPLLFSQVEYARARLSVDRYLRLRGTSMDSE